MSDVIADFKADWELHKKTNDQLIAAKADGKSVADLEAKLAKISVELDAKQAAVTGKIDAMETALKRSSLGSVESKADGVAVDHKKAFMRFVTKGIENGLGELQSKALSVNDDTSGGYMVPHDMSGRIIKHVFETSPIRAYANVQTISTDSLEGMLDINQITNGGWVSESGTRATTATPKIGKWIIPTHEQFAQPAATQKVLEDAAWDAEGWLAMKIADKFSRDENTAFVSGLGGVGAPHGFAAADRTFVEDSTITDDSFQSGKKMGFVKTGASGAFAAAPNSGDCLITTLHALKGEYRNRPGTAWAMARAVFAEVRKLKDSQGRYLWEPSFTAGNPASLLGFPVAEFNDMAAIAANSYSIAFANWAEFYQIVDRVGIRILRDPYTSKPFVLFYATKRTGGDILNFEAAKFVKFIN